MRQTTPATRATLKMRHQLLLAGLVVLWVVNAALLQFGVFPLVPDVPFPIPDSVHAAVCIATVLAAWFWARSRVPPRSRHESIDDYWQRPAVASAAGLVLFLFEGAAVFALIGTMVSGSSLDLMISASGIAGIAASGPVQFEQRVL